MLFALFLIFIKTVESRLLSSYFMFWLGLEYWTFEVRRSIL